MPQITHTVAEGAGEVLYGIGSTIGRRGGEDLGLIYLQLAIYLSPHHSLALLSLADLYENLKKPELAIGVYRKVSKKSALYRNAEIQHAIDLDSLERTEEAKKRLKVLIEHDPSDNEASHGARQHPARAQRVQ